MKKYNISLDIGTNSVGWSVTNGSYELLKLKGKNAWGVSLFEEGETAAPTRSFRCNRRRLRRRKYRLNLLREIFEHEILEEDSSFFIRMKDSFKVKSDKGYHAETDSQLFIEQGFTDVDFYNQYPTIYHLRKALIDQDKAFDLRLVYLAIYHAIKYRGHFIYQDTKIAVDNLSFKENLNVIFSLCHQLGLPIRSFSANEVETIELAMKEKRLSRTQKFEKIKEEIKLDKKDKSLAAILRAILGLTINFKDIFVLSEVPIKGLAFSAGNYEEKIGEVYDTFQDEDKELLLQNMYQLYCLILLSESINVTDTSSQALLSSEMVRKFEAHKEQLNELKSIIKENDTPKEFKSFFRDKTKKNYAAYIENGLSLEELYKEIKKKLNKYKGNYQHIFDLMEKEDYLLKQRMRSNHAIPYQVHSFEVQKILENQEKYHPLLKKRGQDIIKLLEFRIPYYVGPLIDGSVDGERSRFSWMERKQTGKITPWNFEQKVDVDRSAENFIKRMTNTCTYLYGEDVLPKNSIWYQTFEVLNELNKIKIRGLIGRSSDKFVPLEVELKKEIFEQVFKTKKTVTHESLIKWLVQNGHASDYNIEIQGTQKENCFATSMSTFITYGKILKKDLEKFNTPNGEKILEEIIQWQTVFEDRSILNRKLIKKYSDQFTEKQLNDLTKVRLQGWGKLSKKLLMELEINPGAILRKSIYDEMMNTDKNFMQIISEKFVAELIKKVNGEQTGIGENILAAVDEIPGSPALRKGVRQCVKIVKEIEKIIGNSPENIFIEVARSDEAGKRTTARSQRLEKIYNECKGLEKQLKDELKAFKDEVNKNNRLFLYFLQQGKCLYSNAPLDIHNLSIYQIDHIMPQCYVKDDSIENLALVISSENQIKSDDLLVSPDIIRKQKQTWEYLLSIGLMSQKKYFNLTRTKITETDKERFIQRQLVETRQVTKHVLQLFEGHYGESVNVIAIKASVAHDFRRRYKLPKVREINAYHHAHDAYINGVIGEFTQAVYPNIFEKEFILKNYNPYLEKVKAQIKKTHQYPNFYNFIVEKMSEGIIHVPETGEVLWSGAQDISKIKRTLTYKQCNFVRSLEINTGKFYDETIYKKDNSLAKIKLKEGLDPKIYGGRSGKKEAYGVLVEKQKGKKKERVIVSIPIKVSYDLEVGKYTLNDYLNSQVPNLIRVLRKVYKNQLFETTEGFVLYKSAGEKSQGKQVWLSSDVMRTLEEINKSFIDEEIVTDESLLQTFDQILQHSKTVNALNEKYINGVFEKREKYKALSLEEKISILKLLMVILRESGSRKELKPLNIKEKRYSSSVKLENAKIIDQSITGLFKKVIEVEAL